MGDCLGIGIVSYANILNPELIILGGGVVVGFYNYLSAHIKRPFKKQALRDVQNVSIVPSEFETSGPAIGAALLFHPTELQR